MPTFIRNGNDASTGQSTVPLPLYRSELESHSQLPDTRYTSRSKYMGRAKRASNRPVGSKVATESLDGALSSYSPVAMSYTGPSTAGDGFTESLCSVVAEPCSNGALEILSSDDDDMDERSVFLSEFTGRKHASEYPVQRRRTLFRDFIATLNPNTLVPEKYRDPFVYSVRLYGGLKELRNWKKWKMVAIAPLLYDCGIELAREYGDSGLCSSIDYRATKGARELLQMFLFYMLEVNKLTNLRKASAENRRVKAAKKASSKSTVKEIPQGFRYNKDMVCNFILFCYYYIIYYFLRYYYFIG